jgi:hypothetical protein
MVGWRVLKREDIRCMEDDKDLQRNAKQRTAQKAKRWKKREELRAYGLLLVDEDDGMDCDDKGEVGGGSENWRLISWIWMLAGTEGSDAALGKGKLTCLPWEHNANGCTQVCVWSGRNPLHARSAGQSCSW